MIKFISQNIKKIIWFNGSEMILPSKLFVIDDKLEQYETYSWRVDYIFSRSKDIWTCFEITIFSNSLSCLQSLHSMNIDHPYILDILYNYYYVSNQGKKVHICWFSSHISIHGNNEADKDAKSALEFEIEVKNSFYRPLTFH